VTARAGSRRLITGLRALEAILLVVGIAAVTWLGWSRFATARDQDTWARELEAQIAVRQAPPATREGISATAPLARPAKTAAINQVVGRLELQRVGLSAIAREGTDPAILERAVGHIPGTALPGDSGNAAFAGHRDTFFRSLQRVRAGDEIVVTTHTGRHHYVVRDTQVVSPRDVSVLDPTPLPTLTLVTCYPFRYIGSAPERFIVRADLVRKTVSAAR
jgi:sortase A